MKMNKRKGFTLVELIVVIVILGILMGIGALKYADVKRGANLRTLQTNHKNILAALQLQQANNAGVIDTTKYPDMTAILKTDETGLVTGVTQGVPAGAVYDWNKDTNVLTTSVAQTDAEKHYPKMKTAGAISITDNLITGEHTLVPDDVDYWK